MTHILDGIEYPVNYREALGIPTARVHLAWLLSRYVAPDTAALILAKHDEHQRLLNRVAQLYADARRFAQLYDMKYRSPKREAEYQRLRTRLLEPRKRVYREEHDHGNQ